MSQTVASAIPAIEDMCPYIEVFDMPTSLQFYRDLLGFKVVQSSGVGDDVDWVLLQLENIWLMLNTAYEKDNRPSQPDANRINGHHDTAFFFRCSDIEGMYGYLSGKGKSARAPFTTGYGWKAITLKDPDGYVLWFHWPLSQ